MSSGLRSEVNNSAQREFSDLRSFQHSEKQRGPREIFAPRSAAAKKIVAVLRHAGIEVNGDAPSDIQVYDDRFFERVLADGTLGAGESYMDGWWDAADLDGLLAKIHRADPYKNFATSGTLWLALKARVLNRQSQWRSKRVAQEHYDLGNDLYQAMLGRTMQYTCAYWNNAGTLDEAQENKLHLICRKIQLKPGMRVLELGGGFGMLAHFMAAEYGCHVVSYNISREQVAYGRDRCKGLPVRFEQKDYREAAFEPVQFDRVVTIGLCEHIGYKNYRSFLELMYHRLSDHGLALLHTIGGNESETATDPWVDKYIFPNGMIPSIAQLGEAAEGLWVVEDWHNFGPDYDRTLLAWWENFDRAWPSLRARYGDRFYRMWKFYLLGCAGSFRARKLQLWQLVLSKGGIAHYTPVR
jgi:cyclopropane-fatty-acyl-phospholipid synthase